MYLRPRIGAEKPTRASYERISRLEFSTEEAVEKTYMQKFLSAE